MSRYIFGIHSISPWRRTDGKPYGILKVLKGGNLELTGETEDLYGGSSKFPFASESTQINSNLQAQVASYPNFLMELFLGANVTERAAAANGEVVGLANVKGTSLFDAVTGVASISVKSGDEADVKKGRIVLIAVSATEVDVYYVNDVDFSRGAIASYLTDDNKVASSLTVTSGGATTITNFGLEIDGGSGTIALTVGDSAVADVYPAHSGVTEIDVGDQNASFPNFGADMVAAKRATREITTFRMFNVVGSGMPMPLQEKAWSISDMQMKLLRDETENKVFRMIHITEAS